jgi:hypothetical protein
VNTIDLGIRFSAGASGKVGRVEWSLGNGDIAGRVDEFLELSDGDLVSFDPEPVDADPMGRRILGIVLVDPIVYV